MSTPSSANMSNARCSAASWSGTDEEPSPICSTLPLARATPESGSNSWNFRDDEPELITNTLIAIADALCLDCGDGNGVHDVFDQRTPGQIVHRFAQPLQHRADRDRPGAALHRLVGVVTGIE